MHIQSYKPNRLEIISVADPSSAHLPPNPSAPFRAFSLIEIIVTLAIMALLVGLSFPVIAKFKDAGQAQTVRSMLQGLAAAAEEYSVSTGGVVMKNGARQNAFGNTYSVVLKNTPKETAPYPNNTALVFVAEAGLLPAVEKLILAAAGPQLTFNGERVGSIASLGFDPTSAAFQTTTLELVDVWGNRIRYAGGVNKNDTQKDDDYLPAHATAFFASAGPDGLWGEFGTDNQPDDEAKDNLFSFDLQ